MPVRIIEPAATAEPTRVGRVRIIEPAPQAAKPGVFEQVGGLMANVNASIPFGDEIVAGLNTAGGVVSAAARGQPVSLGRIQDRFKSEMGTQRGLESGFAAAHPVAANLGKGTGMAATLALPGAKALQGSRLGNVARGAITASTTAAAYSLADRGTGQERIQRATAAAYNPFVLALGGGAGALVGRSAAKPQAAAVPSVDALRAAKSAAYDAADKAGVRYTPAAFDGFVTGLTKEARAANLNPTRHPHAASMLDDIQAMQGQSPSLTELDQLRQVVQRDVVGKSDRAEKMFGRKMIDHIDNLIETAGPGGVVAGNADEGAKAIALARELNGAYRKVEAVSNAVESATRRAKATGSGGNIDNAIRTKLITVLEKTPNLSGAERAALQRAIDGGNVQNALRLLGKLSPQGNGLMLALNLGGAALGGMAGAGPAGLVPAIVGAASKTAADQMTRQNVQRITRLMATPAIPAAAPTFARPGLLPQPVEDRAARAAGLFGYSGGQRASNR